MNAPDLVDQMLMQRPLVRVPEAGQCLTLLQAFKRGERLTVLTALQGYGVMALSQRVGEIKRMGWPVKSQMIETATGKRVAEYWMED